MAKIIQTAPFKLVNPIDWAQVDRCMFAALVSVIYCILQSGIHLWFFAHPEHAPFIDYKVLEGIQLFLYWATLFWSVLFALTLWLRKKTDQTPKLAAFIIGVIGLPILALVYLNGVLISSSIFTLMAVTIIGLFLFDFRPIVYAVCIMTAIFLGGSIAYLSDIIPHSPLYRAIPDVKDAKWWVMAQFAVGLYPFFTSAALTIYFLIELHSREKRITELSRKDGLTEVWNRRYLMELFDCQLAMAKRTQTPFSLMMLDLDFFKKINDEYGHAMGDATLVQVSTAIQQTLRGTDILGRYGGEEFVIILPGCGSETAQEVAERCRVAVESTQIKHEGKTISVTSSIGITSIQPPTDEESEQILECADQALYSSKENGRNQVTFKSLAEMNESNLAG